MSSRSQTGADIRRVLAQQAAAAELSALSPSPEESPEIPVESPHSAAKSKKKEY